MKVPTVLTTAIAAWSATAAPLSQSNNITAQPSKGNVSAPEYIPVRELLTNTTAYDQAIIDCAQKLSKTNNETRSKLSVDAKRDEHDVCQLIFGTIFPEKRPQSNITHIGKNHPHFFDVFHKANATGIHSRSLNSQHRAFEEGYFECMRHRLDATRPLCLEIAHTVTEKASEKDHVSKDSKHSKRGPKRKDEYDSMKEEQEQRRKQWKQGIIDKFSHGIEACTNGMSRNSTMGTKDTKTPFDACIKDVTERYSGDLVSFELSRVKAKDAPHISGPLAGINYDWFYAMRDSRRERASQNLSEDLTKCRLDLLGNSIVLTEHGLNFSTRSFKRCVEHSAEAYAARLDDPFAGGFGRRHLQQRSLNDTEISSQPEESSPVDPKGYADGRMSSGIKNCIASVAHNSTMRAQDKEFFDYCIENVAAVYSKDLKTMSDGISIAAGLLGFHPINRNGSSREKAFHHLEKSLAQCHSVYISTAVELPASLLKHTTYPFEACAHHAAEKYLKLIDNIRNLEQHHFNNATSSGVRVLPDNSTGIASNLTRRGIFPWRHDESKAEEEQKRIDELKRQDSAKNFKTGLSNCNNALSNNSTNATISMKERFATCITDVTNHYSDDLVAIEEFKTSFDPILPEEERSSKRKHAAREHQYRQLRSDFRFCRLNFQHKTNRTVIINHRVNNATIREFQGCIGGKVMKYTHELDNINRFMGPDYKEHVSKPFHFLPISPLIKNIADAHKNSTIASRDIQSEAELGSAVAQTFHANELYSLASLAHSYNMNTCYDKVPFDTTYNVRPGNTPEQRPEFQECKVEMDEKNEKLKSDINAFLESHVVYDVKHGDQFWEAVQRLRNCNYSCGRDGQCFTDAVYGFMNTVKKMPLERGAEQGAVLKREEDVAVQVEENEVVEEWRALIPNI